MTGQTNNTVDVFVIGGGINGVGIARDAVGRGYSVCLCEANDLASGTSSNSSKLIHGGLRYLEHYDFGLVRKALLERETLLAMAPHIIRPMRFVLPHSPELRPRWMLRIGLFLYDYLGKRKVLPGSRSLNLVEDVAGEPLKSRFRKGFEYSDCWVDDARLVILNAMDAAEKGAQIHVRTRVLKVERQNGFSVVTTKDTATGQVNEFRAKVVINAAGPWVDEVLGSVFDRPSAQNVRQVRGSHIVVSKLFDHEKAYIFQNADGRIIFAIPYEEDFTLIGTTDEDHGDDLSAIKISPSEIEYICQSASEYFEQNITTEDVVWSYSGVRPLYDDGASEAQEATRDYVIETEAEEDTFLINIFGGKITTYRRLSEEILELVEGFLGKRGGTWTDQSILPGGDIDTSEFAIELQSQFPFLDQSTAFRMARSYGSMALSFLNKAVSVEDLGQDFGAGLYQVEVEYLLDQEWAKTTDDILFRRTKLGVGMAKANVTRLEVFLNSREDFKPSVAASPFAASA